MYLIAGADISELAKVSTSEAYRIGWLKDIEDAFSTFRKPVIAAVQGFAVRKLGISWVYSHVRRRRNTGRN